MRCFGKNRALMFAALMAVLVLFSPVLQAEAAWVTTDAGLMYTISSDPGYATGKVTIGSEKYYFDENGIMQTGFVTINGKLLYFSEEDGTLQYGWITVGDKKYYAKDSGVLYVSAWHGKYYFQADGSMAVSTWVGNKWVGANGKYTGKTKTGFVTLEGDTYYYTSASKYATGWFKVDGKYYYADSNGVVQKSTWVGKKYVNSKGVMVTGMKTIGSKTYIFKSSGTRYSSCWVQYNGKYYYCNSKGVVQKSTWIDGKKYVDEDGVMVTGFYTIDSKTYYFNSKGTLKKKCWIRVDGVRYRLNASGVVRTSCWINDTYYASSTGAILTGLNAVGGEIYYFDTTTGAKITKTMKKVGSATYYFKANSGEAVRSSWVKYNGNYYYFQSDGKMATSTWIGKYYVNSSGVRTSAVRPAGWWTYNGSTYYLDSNGDEMTGFQTISGSTYYFDSTGAMVTGLQTIGSNTYYFYSDGTMATSITIVVGSVQYTIDSSGVVTEAASISISGDSLGVQIANFAIQYVGNPYVYGGTSLTNGADCSGFVYAVFACFNIKLLRTADEQMDGPSASQIAAGYAEAVEVDLDSLKPGDLIFYGSSSYASHVAIYIGDGQIVHASNSQAYPKGGIKISDYDYRTPVKAVRYWS
ncbi:MAG: NlpC/P60 family protein [Lachnospiraceae bacterium]|nr:NlpC/P60 family protein [Lachnospiraceae bacterium]